MEFSGGLGPQTICREMSGGEAAVAPRALAQTRPSSGRRAHGNLSQSSQQRDLLFDSCREAGRIVVVTHDLNLAERADYILRIEDGVLVKEVA